LNVLTPTIESANFPGANCGCSTPLLRKGCPTMPVNRSPVNGTQVRPATGSPSRTRPSRIAAIGEPAA